MGVQCRPSLSGIASNKSGGAIKDLRRFTRSSNWCSSFREGYDAKRCTDWASRRGTPYWRLVAAQGEIFDIWLTQSAKTAGCTHLIAANKCSAMQESSVNKVTGRTSCC